jgi:hypothetical protein
MRALTFILCLTLCLTLVTAPMARADIIGPPDDPARHDKIIGIATADTGVGLLLGGIAMLAVGATRDTETEVKLRADLNLAGGLFTAFGVAAAGVGAVIWLLARKQTMEWQKRSALSLAPSGVQLRF